MIRQPSRQRGFTLIELLIASTIMIVAVVVAGAVIMSAMSMTRTATQRGDEGDWSRIALNDIVRSVSNAGSGVPGGIFVAVGGTAPTTTTISAIFGRDGTTGLGATSATLSCPDPGATGTPSTPIVTPSTDDLWVVVPASKAMAESCVDPGAAMTVMTAGSPLKVGCTAGQWSGNSLFAAGDSLLVTNMTTGAIITGTAVLGGAAGPPAAPGTLTYSESGTALSDSPDKGGFEVGDMVYGVNLFHYFVANDVNGVPGLYRANGKVTGAPPGGVYPNGPYPTGGPFIDTSAGALVQKYVDDLQIVYGLDTTNSGNPATYTWQHGLSPTQCASPNFFQLRAMRISVEVESSNLAVSNDDRTVFTDDNRHQFLENNYDIPTDNRPASDGHRRVIYTRNVELPNTSPGSL